MWFEPLVHEAAKKLGIDQLRRKMNAPEGQAVFGLVPPNTPPGRPRSKLTSCFVKECLDRAPSCSAGSAQTNSGKRTGSKFAASVRHRRVYRRIDRRRRNVHPAS